MKGLICCFFLSAFLFANFSFFHAKELSQRGMMVCRKGFMQHWKNGKSIAKVMIWDVFFSSQSASSLSLLPLAFNLTDDDDFQFSFSLFIRFSQNKALRYMEKRRE
jgi:hypothetical protein